MKYIKGYKLYLEADAIQPNSADTTQVAADKNNMNATIQNVSEFNSRKANLTNIYMTYKDEKDLVNKLIAQKFINKGTKITDVVFINPLLGMWAQCAQKRRELQDLQNKINQENKTLTDTTNSLNNNPSSKETINQNNENDKKQIGDDRKTWNDLNKTVQSMEKDVMDRLNQIKTSTQKEQQNINNQQKNDSNEAV